MIRNDVLIIGAGPSGLFAAAELARHGVEARLIERDLQPHREARATSIQPGTLEILATVGLLPPFLEAAERIHCSRMYGPGMSEIGSMSHDGIGCRCEFQCSLPQYETQRILESHLLSVGGVVERGVTATKVETDPDGLFVELVDANGKRETVRPKVVIGAGGAHSVTRHSMSEPLQGTTYRGHFLVADIAMPAPFPRTEAGVICGPNGLLLLAPLPGGRWISFQDLEEDVEQVSVDEVVARVEVRLGKKYRPTDVSWFAPFRMHRRIVSRLADGRRFLIGDAAHLSSPFGGEGLNAGLHDGYDLAWKLALVLSGRASRSLLDAYMTERRIADHHVLDVSDQVHHSIVEVATAARQRREIQAAGVDPIAAALVRNSRAMIDVDYWGSPLVVDYGGGAASVSGPRPGQWYPDWTRFGGTSHHVLVFGTDADSESLALLGRRWSQLVQIAHNPNVDPLRAGLPAGGTVLIRPDGHIGFRFPSADADAFQALDRHLSSYLIPQPTAA
ncbi:MAG TPA: FAD-dependent monooxygenase [Planctomycetaceae bacterium]|nr:FAD-dependent monooxygenase [Planctomycetaceae bacterium]